MWPSSNQIGIKRRTCIQRHLQLQTVEPLVTKFENLLEERRPRKPCKFTPSTRKRVIVLIRKACLGRILLKWSRRARTLENQTTSESARSAAARKCSLRKAMATMLPASKKMVLSHTGAIDALERKSPHMALWIKLDWPTRRSASGLVWCSKHLWLSVTSDLCCETAYCILQFEEHLLPFHIVILFAEEFAIWPNFGVRKPWVANLIIGQLFLLDNDLQALAQTYAGRHGLRRWLSWVVLSRANIVNQRRIREYFWCSSQLTRCADQIDWDSMSSSTADRRHDKHSHLPWFSLNRFWTVSTKLRHTQIASLISSPRSILRCKFCIVTEQDHDLESNSSAKEPASDDSDDELFLTVTPKASASAAPRSRQVCISESSDDDFFSSSLQKPAACTMVMHPSLCGESPRVWARSCVYILSQPEPSIWRICIKSRTYKHTLMQKGQCI